MAKYALLEELQNPKTDDKTPLPRGIKYQDYELSLCGSPTTVFIPLKEAEAFERAIADYSNTLDRSQLKQLLHKFRGIRG